MVVRVRVGFTLVELLIVVVILGILAAVVVPQFSDASEEANNARVAEDLRNLRMAIARYTIDHDGRAPSIKANGAADAVVNNFISRLTGRTDKSGAINASGAYGPYLSAFPSNPLTSPAAQAANVKFGTGNPPSGVQGWYYNTSTYKISINTSGYEGL
ncbi:MAG: type II secretion system protein [Phycisphaerales bacterium]|nr:type II secretion system protein [Phycisphaerales bacterium]